MHTQRQLNKGAEDNLNSTISSFWKLDFTALIMAFSNKVFDLIRNIITQCHMLLSKIYKSEMELYARASQNHRKFFSMWKSFR